MWLIYLLFLFIFVVAGVAGIICIKIKLAGMNVMDFIKFITAIGDLDTLYKYTKNTESMTTLEQAAFIDMAEKIFKAFDKVPSIIWEEEYDKYNEVLEKYKDIRILRWANNNA